MGLFDDLTKADSTYVRIPRVVTTHTETRPVTDKKYCTSCASVMSMHEPSSECVTCIAWRDHGGG